MAADTETLTGTTGEDTKAAAKPYPGFTAKDFEQKTIAADGSTVINIYYDRNEYTVSYDYGHAPEGASKLPDAVKYKFGAEVTVAPDATATGYTFSGWDTEDATVNDGKFEMPANDVKLNGSFSAATDTAYTVKHYQQNLADNEYTLVAADTETLTGTTGEDTKAAAKPYPGFTAKDFEQKTIAADGSTVINIYYDRNEYTVTFVSNGGTEVKPQTVTYDNTADNPPAPTKGGYTFAGWYTDNEKFTTKYDFATPVTGNITLYAMWTRNYTPRPYTPPTVVIPDDDALGLNTTDHFAYIVGYGNGEVRPQNNITRAEVATIFFRLLTDDVRDENLTKTNRYSDVAATSWYNTAVSTLSSMGIITGYPDGTFRPNAAITRAEFAAIAARFDHDGDKTAAKFSDIANHWAKDEISIAYNNGWITGYPDGTFGPQRDITRAETVTLVNRVLNRQPETEDDLLPNMTVWTDNANSKAWYYLAVQEATNSHYYKFKTNSKYEKWTELRETRDWTQLEK